MRTGTNGAGIDAPTAEPTPSNNSASHKSNVSGGQPKPNVNNKSESEAGNALNSARSN